MPQEKISFLRLLKHQLKGPLTIVNGYLSFWESGTSEKFSAEKQKMFVLKALESSRKLDELINDAFTALAIERNELQFDFEEIDVNELLKEVYEKKIERLHHDKGLEFKLEVEENIPPFISDRRHLAVILGKLIDNAFKFTNQDPITVTAKKENENVIFTVRDNGKGFTSEEKKQVFQRMFHGSLSLYIVNETVMALGGKIMLESEGREKGSLFTVRFPIPKNAIKKHDGQK